MVRATVSGLVLSALLAGAWSAAAQVPPGGSGRGRAPSQAPSCAPQELVPAGTGYFTDVSDASGITLGNFDPVNPVIANDHTRVAVADLNGDGWDDIVMHSGAQIPAKMFEHLVFFNHRDGTFVDASDYTGLRKVQAAFFAFGDVDNDGDQDCFAGTDAGRDGSTTGWTHQLLLNDGAGRFTVRARSGLEGSAAQPHVAAIGVFGDYNGDGKLDLFVGNGSTGMLMSDQLYYGNGDGTFVDASYRLRGTTGIVRASNGGVACDYDNDHDLDIFVSVYGAAPEADYAHNVLWENDGRGSFTNVARERGFEALATGNYMLFTTGFGRNAEPVPPERWMAGNGFGLHCEDVNNDGNLDVYQANISHPVDLDYNRRWSDPSVLLINEGPSAGYHFKNVFLDAKLQFSEGDLGGSMADADNDGLVDVAMSRESRYEQPDTAEKLMGWFGFYRQLPDGTFADDSFTSGINWREDPARSMHKRAKGSGAHSWSDVDHDGDLDLLVGAFQRYAEVGRANYLFRNDIGSRNAWLAFRLVGDGRTINRDAVGARVELVYGDEVLTRELKANRGMDNADDTRVLHFGLGDRGCPATIRVTWPNASVTTLDGSTIGQNRYVTLRFGDAAPIEPTVAPTPTDFPQPTATATATVTPEPQGRTIFLPAAQDMAEWTGVTGGGGTTRAAGPRGRGR